MATIDAWSSTSAYSVCGADEVTAQLPIRAFSCRRLGRVANPPSFSFTDWVRSARRRCPCPSTPPDAADDEHDNYHARTGQ